MRASNERGKAIFNAMKHPGENKMFRVFKPFKG
jgi:hypothetical protein